MSSRELPPAARRRSRLARLVALVAVSSCVALVVQSSPAARADSQLDALQSQKSTLKSAISSSDDDLDEFSNELNAAADALVASQTQLADAQATLAAAQSERDAAQSEDIRLASELAAAQERVAKAKQDVEQGKADLEAEKKLIGLAARRTQQQGGPLVGLVAFTTSIGTGDIEQRYQWSKQIFNATQNQMDRLTAAQMRYEAAEQAEEQAEQQAQQLRDEAAANLQTKKDAESAATAAQAEVTELVAKNQQAKDAAAAQVAAEEKRNAELQAESDAVDARIKARIAEMEAEAKKKAEEEAAKKKAEQEKQQSSSSSDRNENSSRSDERASNGFIEPVVAPVTSSYGMRFHPILHVWKLHDGMDLGASCNTPIKAAADGVVTEEYYNAGYGNRLMIDHGLINGSYFTTGYNHASRYIVKVGDHVTQGQVIGYVGQTGYATGCHLHLMVWKNGTLIDPASYF